MGKTKIVNKKVEELDPNLKPEVTEKIEIKKDKKKLDYKGFAALIERYKKQNPVKYTQKKVALEKALSALK